MRFKSDSLATELLSPQLVGQPGEQFGDNKQQRDDQDVDEVERQSLEHHFFQCDARDTRGDERTLTQGRRGEPDFAVVNEHDTEPNGATPKARMMGSNTGVTSMMVAAVSTNIFRKTKRVITMNQTTYTCLVNPRIQTAIMREIRSSARMRPKL